MRPALCFDRRHLADLWRYARGLAIILRLTASGVEHTNNLFTSSMGGQQATSLENLPDPFYKQ